MLISPVKKVGERSIEKLGIAGLSLILGWSSGTLARLVRGREDCLPHTGPFKKSLALGGESPNNDTQELPFVESLYRPRHMREGKESRDELRD